MSQSGVYIKAVGCGVLGLGQSSGFRLWGLRAQDQGLSEIPFS